MDISPTFKGYIEDENDALLILQATLDGKLQQIPRRPYEIERPYLIVSGSIFVFVEEVSGIKRWTDGISWSPSRITGKFLVYRELDKSSGQGHGHDLEISSTSMRYSGLIKKTLSVKLKRAPLHVLENFHIVSYYTIDDAKEKRIMCPKTLVFFNDVVPSPELVQAMENTTLGNVKTSSSSSGTPSNHKSTPLSPHASLSGVTMINVPQLQTTGNALAMAGPLGNMGSQYYLPVNGGGGSFTNGNYQTVFPNNTLQHHTTNINCNNSDDKNNFGSVKNSNANTTGTIPVDQSVPMASNTNNSYYYSYVPTKTAHHKQSEASSSPQQMLVKNLGSRGNSNAVIDLPNDGNKIKGTHNTGSNIHHGIGMSSMPPINTSYYYQTSSNSGGSRANPVAYSGGIPSNNPPYYEGNTGSSNSTTLPGIHTQAHSNVVPYFPGGANISGSQLYPSMSRNYPATEAPLNQPSINSYHNYQSAPTNTTVLNNNNGGNALTRQSSSNTSQQHQTTPASISYSHSFTQPPSMYQQYYSTNQKAYNSRVEKGFNKLRGSSSSVVGQSLNNPQGIVNGPTVAHPPGAIPFISSTGSTHSSNTIPVPSTTATTPATITSGKAPPANALNTFPVMSLDRQYPTQNPNTQGGNSSDNRHYKQ